jgi:hypothetical protein
MRRGTLEHDSNWRGAWEGSTYATEGQLLRGYYLRWGACTPDEGNERG